MNSRRRRVGLVVVKLDRRAESMNRGERVRHLLEK